MALIPSSLRRPSALLRMPDAIKRGLTPTAFINQLRGLGLTYRKTLMLSDWRSASGVEAKKDTIKFVRKDRIPSSRSMADVEWELSKEYMYKANTWSRLKPDEPLTERFVNLMSDVPMSLAAVEREVMASWGEWEKYAPEHLEKVQVVSAFHRIESPLDEGE